MDMPDKEKEHGSKMQLYPQEVANLHQAGECIQPPSYNIGTIVKFLVQQSNFNIV